jgi:hypothetical protein
MTFVPQTYEGQPYVRAIHLPLLVVLGLLCFFTTAPPSIPSLSLSSIRCLGHLICLFLSILRTPLCFPLLSPLSPTPFFLSSGFYCPLLLGLSQWEKSTMPTHVPWPSRLARVGESGWRQSLSCGISGRRWRGSKGRFQLAFARQLSGAVHSLRGHGACIFVEAGVVIGICLHGGLTRRRTKTIEAVLGGL